MSGKKKRKYVKKDKAYWDQFGKRDLQKSNAITRSNDFQPELLGDAYYTSSSSAGSGAKSTASYSRRDTPVRRSRKNLAAFDSAYDPFSAIRKGILPFNYDGNAIDVRDTIVLCQKAYANVAVFRNAIDIMSEFANSEIFLKGGSMKSRNFFNEWFEKINLNNLKDQYFREYYRSGNIFLYRLDGVFETADFLTLVDRLSNNPNEATNSIPVKYVLLNPYDIVAKASTSFSKEVYTKALSKYEIVRLRNPQNEIDQAVFDALPEKTKKDIKDGYEGIDGVYIELDPEKLVTSFYKKQDYEPFAIPFGYPVLHDINAKLELKKMDQAITRTVENVVLLITMGAEPDKGGVNQKNLLAMQELMRNESVGRILVSDYTTKAEFIIPDLKRVLGPEKYITLNEDIKQGLQNIVVGEEKYSATQVKAQIFVDRLKEARSAFLSSFLQPQIESVSRSLGFRQTPTAYFKDINMRDETQLMRVVTRLIELGVFTPQQGMEMFETGQFPDAEDLRDGHEEFIKDRKKGLYNPIVGGVPVIEPAGADKDRKIQEKSVDAGITAKKQAAKQNKTPRVAGRPEGTTGIPVDKSDSVSLDAISKTIKHIEIVRGIAEAKLLEEHGLEKLSEAQEKVLDKLIESVVVSTDLEKWEEKAVSCVNDISQVTSLMTKAEVLDLAAEHDLEDYPAALLYHSQQDEEEV